MKINRYIIAAIVLIAVVFFAYFYHFYWQLNYKLSNDPSIWAQLGDYAGGILNPLLTFISLVLLLKSLGLQNQANASLLADSQKFEKNEKLKSFETLFFNLINSQRQLFEQFSIKIPVGEAFEIYEGVVAVKTIEEIVQNARDAPNIDDENEVVSFIKAIDFREEIFGLCRAFYILVKIITERLSDSEKFSAQDRRDHYMALIHFTDFAHLKLIMTCVQYMDYPSCKYIRSHREFKDIIEEVNLSYNLYK